MDLYLAIIIITILISSKINLKKQNDEYLSKESTACIKGIFVLQVFYRHIKGYIDNSKPGFKIINKFDIFLCQLVVSPFLFYSGYGVMESIKKNKNYVNSIPKKRLLITWINFVIAVLIYLVINLLLGISLSKKQLVLSFVGWDSIGNSNWYIFSIIALYYITYVSFSIFKDEKKSLIHTWFFTIMYILLISLFKEGWWYDTVLAYPFGMSFSYHKSSIEKIIRDNKKYMNVIIISAFSFFALYLNQSLFKFEYQFVSISFAFLVVLISFKININSKILSWIGNNLFSFYIMMRVPMIVFTKLKFNNNVYAFCVLSFIFTIIATFLFSILINKVDRRFLKG